MPTTVNRVFEHLIVLHRPRTASGTGVDPALLDVLAQYGPVVDTCLRQLAILHLAGPMPSALRFAGLELMRGTEAYAFLLQTVTGLNSAVAGETNVHGQVREAWEHWCSMHSDESAVTALQPLMQQLFADSREIRRRYLQGIGGNSYGTLVRKLLAPVPDSRVLFVGAGALARSVHPYFAAWPTAVWNRHPVTSGPLAATTLFAPADMTVAADWATMLVVTAPAATPSDRDWAELAAARRHTVVHLGCRRAAQGQWGKLRSRLRMHDLDDVFELQAAQDALRAARLARARRACLERAGHAALPATQPQRVSANQQ